MTRYLVVFETKDFLEDSIVIQAETPQAARKKAIEQQNNISFILATVPLD